MEERLGHTVEEAQELTIAQGIDEQQHDLLNFSLSGQEIGWQRRMARWQIKEFKNRIGQIDKRVFFIVRQDKFARLSLLIYNLQTLSSNLGLDVCCFSDPYYTLLGPYLPQAIALGFYRRDRPFKLLRFDALEKILQGRMQAFQCLRMNSQ